MMSRPSIVHPPALTVGDRVHVVSPAGPVVPDNIAEGLEVLEGWGLDVVVDEAVYRRRQPYGYLAGRDDQRLNALTEAWTDPDCRAVVCSRGGYGTMRLLEDLDLERMVDTPRLLVGFSDITALHLYLAGLGGLATVHGPVVKSLKLHDDGPHDSVTRLREALFATSEAPRPWTDLRTVRSGTARGPVLGGNLSLVTSMLATPFAPSLDGTIAVLEDVGEDDYRLDRMLTALRLAEDTELAGLVLGDFTDCEGTFVDDDQLEAFVDQLGSAFDCPVVADAPVGHGSRNVAFPVGVPATLDADRGRLVFDRHAAQPHSD